MKNKEEKKKQYTSQYKKRNRNGFKKRGSTATHTHTHRHTNKNLHHTSSLSPSFTDTHTTKNFVDAGSEDV